MSDLLDRLQPDRPLAADRSGDRTGLAESNEFWDRLNRKQQEKNRRRQENIDRYVVHLSDGQYEILNLAIANGEIPEEEAYNMASAIKLAERYDIPLADARQNLERYRDALFGTEKRHTPKDTFTAIADNWQIGKNTLALGWLGNELYYAHEAGDAEKAAALWAEIQGIQQENESLADHQDRSLVVEALKFGAQSAPFSGAVALPSLLNLLAPGAGTAASFAISATLAKGGEYIDLLEAGADPETARRVAPLSGAVQAAVEVALGNVASVAGGAAKLLGKKALGSGAQALAEKLTADIFKRLHFSGAFKRAALRIGAGYLFEALEEGTEEVIQELASAAALQAAATLQGEGVETKTAQELGDAVGQAFRGGLLGSLVLGIPGTALNSFATVRDANRVVAAARTNPSREAFKKDTARNKIFEGMSGEKREAAQDELYSQAQKRREQEEARIAAEIKERGSQLAGLEERTFNEEGEDATPGAYRKPDGSLYTRIEDERRSGEVTTGSFRMGDGSRATKSNTYGAIDYRIENGVLTIRAMNVVDHRADLTGEFFEGFARKFADLDIQWDPETETGRALKEQLAAANRRGPDAGLNYFESEAGAEEETYRIRLDKQLREHTRLGAEEREAWIQLWEAAGEQNGLGLQGTFDRVYADPENIFSDALEDAQAAQAEGRKIKGATFWKETEQGLRAVVYVAKNGDFSTLSHESLHAYRQALKGIDPGLSAEIDRVLDNEAKRAPGANDEDYNRAREEYLAKRFEEYLYNGTAPEPALKSLFDQIAAFMRRIYSYLSGKQELSPEIQDVFDRMFSGYDARQTEETAGKSPGAGSYEEQINKKIDELNREGREKAWETIREREKVPKKPATGEAATGAVDASGVSALRERYQGAKKTYGRSGTINANGTRLRGRYVVAEAGTYASSHGRDFRQTPGYPRRADGSTVNDNDYENRPDAQESVLKQGYDFDERGLGIVGTRDGIIVSGNGRNIAAQIAAAQGTNAKYLEGLRDNIEGYGLTQSDLAAYQNPELAFELDDEFDYSTEAFAQFNVNTQKAASPMETAVKMSKRLAENPGVVRAAASVIDEHETLPELYADKKAVQKLFDTLQTNKIIGEYERPQYVDEKGKITRNGEDLLESVMLGSVLEEGNIRGLYDAPALRQKLVRGVTALVENKAMGKYSFIPEMNEAVGIALAVNNTVGRDGKRIYGTVQDYVRQLILPGMPAGLSIENRASIQLAEALESGGQKDFALWLGGLNASLAAAARGQADIFTEEVESKESILDRYVGFREGLDKRKAENHKTLTDPTAGPAAKAQAALDDAGIAKTEILFQIIGEQGAAALDKAEETTVRLDNLDVARRMEAAGKDAKAVRLATGWERGADGKWRYELGDAFHFDLSKLNEAGSFEGRLDEILSHNELFAAYPQLRNAKLTVNNQEELRHFFGVPYAGAYSEAENWLRINYRTLERGGIESLDSIFVHETQHAIQAIEGFSYGSNTDRFDALFNDTEDITEFLELDQKYRQYRGKKKLAEWLAMPDNFRRIQSAAIKDIVIQFRNGDLGWSEAFDKLWEFHQQHYDNIEKKRDAYERSGGEAEARNVQARMGFTAQQRLETLLEETEDVSREDQLFLTEGAQMGAAMAFADTVDVSQEEQKERLINALESSAVPMDTREFSREEYNKAFPRGTVETPVGQVKIGKNQFEKLGSKDKGKRKSLIGAMYQTLSDPLAIIREKRDDRLANVFIKTFSGGETKKADTVLTVVVDINREQIAISTYKRKYREVVSKIKKADGIVYIKDNGGSLTNGDNPRHNQVSGETGEKSSPETLFQTYEELLEDAARYESAAAFEEAYRNPETRPEDAAVSTEADRRWYEIFWRDARIAAGITEAAEPSAPEQGDRAFLRDINRDRLRDILINLDEKLHDRQKAPVAPEPGEDRAAYDRELAEHRKAQALKDRISRELPHYGAWVGVASKVANRAELSVKDYNTLRGYLRSAPRDYRALFADLTGRREWGLNLTEMKDGVPDTPLSAPRLERPDDTDAKNRERLAGAIEDADPDLAKEIREGTITVDDPRIRAFEQGLEAGIKKADEAIAAVEAEIAEDARKFSDTVKRTALELYREFKAAEEKYQARTTETARKIRQGQELTGRYQQEERLLLTDFDSARAAFDDYVSANDLRAEVREELARIDARYAERQRLKDLQKKRQAVREVKRIEESLIKRITRKISRKAERNNWEESKRTLTVAYDEARVITIIQSLFEPSLFAGVNRLLGTIQGPALREIYMKWKTDAEFREELRREAGNKATKIGDILGKPEWDYISNQEKRDLIRMLPKQDWISKLNLKDLEKYLDDSIPLDMKLAKGAKSKDGHVWGDTVIPGTEEERIAREALGDELYSRILHKPLEGWTMLELAELAEIVDDLYVEGREKLRARNEARHIQYEQYRDKLSDILRITKHQINPGDSPEEQKRKQGEIAKILGKYMGGDPGAEAAKLARRSLLDRWFGGAYSDANVRRVARILDNGKDGTFTNLLYWQENDAFNLRERAKMSRSLAVQASMEKLGIKTPELFQKLTVKDLWGAGADQVYTVEELLGMKLALRDELSRRAVIYGNLAKEGERSKVQNDSDVSMLERLTDAAEGRLAKVTAVADAFFSQAGNDKYLKFMEAIARDYDAVYDRLNRANIDVFNQPVWKVEHYFPMFRLDRAGGVNEKQEVKDLLGVAGATTQWTDNGMTQKRIHIGPEHQTGIALGLYTTWVKSLDRTEHFIAYAPYVRTLNMVFRSLGKAMMEQLQNRYGEGMEYYIKEYINEKANPAAENNRHASDNIVKAMRGRAASAYLAWKISGVLKQAATSPWPYLQYMNPAEYAAACVRFYRDPKAASAFIKERSIFMATRSFDPVIKTIREQQALNRNKALGKLDQFNNRGMKGIEMVDWACVAPGWLAVYNREMARLLKANEGLAADQQLSMADMEYEAVAKADDIVRLTQPSDRDTDQAPMFKNTPQAMRAFLQFTQSLNVIWQNIRYDMPAAVRQGQALQIVGGITGYILAGVSLGVLAEGLDWEDDDEKKKVAWQRKLLFYSFTQFTDAVPYIGDGVTAAWEAAATGRRRWSGGDNLFPAAKEAGLAAGAAINAWQKLGEGNAEAAQKSALKTLEHFEAGFAYSLGLPQSGAKELLRAAGLDPWGGDWEPEFNPGALAGRR